MRREGQPNLFPHCVESEGVGVHAISDSASEACVYIGPKRCNEEVVGGERTWYVVRF